MQINAPAPDFSLPDLDGTIHRLSGYRGRTVIVNFWSAECPWSAQADAALRPWLAGWGERVACLTVACNVNEPPDLLAEQARERGVQPVLTGAGSGLADAWNAETTPHFFVIDPSGMLRYCGAFDDITFRQRTATRQYLREAVEALLAGRLPDPAETPAYGCTIVRSF
jgi:hypothetical protein